MDEALASLAGSVDELIGLVLVTRATGPSYRRAEESLRSMLQAKYGAMAAPLLDRATTELLDALQGDPRGVGLRHRRIVDRLADDLAAGGADLEHDDTLVADLGEALGLAYLSGRAVLDRGQAPTDPASVWDTDFALPDQDALAGLVDSGLWWVGTAPNAIADPAERDRLLVAIREAMEGGEARDEAGRRLREVFRGRIERSDTYWRGLAATAMTRARSLGALSSMVELGASTYTYTNPMDERTSDVCAALNGTTFTLRQSVELRDRLLATAQTPDEWKTASPWPRLREVVDEDGAPLPSAELQAKGIAWPPLHFHCRSAIDVAEWSDEWPGDTDPIGDVDLTKALNPPPKKPKKPKITPRDLVFGPDTTPHAHAIDYEIVDVSPEARAAAPSVVMEVQTAMSRVPPRMKEYAHSKAANVFVVAKLADRFPHLAGVRPRGWGTRDTWDDVRGCGGVDATVAVLGTEGGEGWDDVTLHEWGHAIDRLTTRKPRRLSNQDWWTREHAVRTEQIKEWGWERGSGPSYFLQPGEAGPEEWWASVISDAYRSDETRAMVDKHFPGLLDTMAERIAKEWKLT